MAQIEEIDERTVKIHVQLDDAVQMIGEAQRDITGYAHDIVTITEKMPFFDYVNFCFYAYNSADLFEWMLGMNPKDYQSFSLDAPDSFFYSLFGGMAALYNNAKQILERTA
ncbi:hypothetical protein [Alicyclobacillus sp. SO9]|uniref:hypothetical protein n=1 Tax=Alicyclobacillus sp. SO9 TaxID=2665646 RepID=UPI0018E7DF83|nr:hypothetical protein [Alicyclobacillus sp. SO9]QQE80993.1 hypothetical protein GI364_11795 [Alicyclobacillus sp. SO9]